MLPYDKGLSNDHRLLPTGPSLNNEHFEAAEALRELRTNIRFMDVDRPPRVIVVTSPLPGDGKSTTCVNLATTIAATGEPVVLVDADLRRPVVHTIFGLIGEVGLSTVLSGSVNVDDALQAVAGSPSLRVLTAGRTPPNPSEVLSSGRMAQLLSELSESATVIIDAPPVLPVTDAAVLSTRADGCLIVVGAGRTTFDVLKRALQSVERVGARCFGVVINRVPKRGGSYGYRYARSYYAAAPAAEEPSFDSLIEGPYHQIGASNGSSFASESETLRALTRKEKRARE